MTNPTDFTPVPKPIDARPAYAAALGALEKLAEDAPKIVQPASLAEVICALNGTVAVLQQTVVEQEKRDRDAQRDAAAEHTHLHYTAGNAL